MQKEREVERRKTNLTLCAQRRGEPALHHRLDGGGAVADQLGPPAPAAGQVAGCPSALGQVAEEAEAVGQVAGAAGGQVAGGAGCWAGQGEEPLAAGDQGGKLCSMQVHRQTDREERKEKDGQLKCTTSKRVI